MLVRNLPLDVTYVHKLNDAMAANSPSLGVSIAPPTNPLIYVCCFGPAGWTRCASCFKSTAKSGTSTCQVSEKINFAAGALPLPGHLCVPAAHCPNRSLCPSRSPAEDFRK